ncbi:hypothetical protein CkaCkLH20_02195 [Colletotrichum karsti]|uniref:Uncharacterized protein n=1 Tax=Colletotrichum karsti TaxID=1095194 RepID=A0A9P6IE69_9PEZI|nr:uncharacterized protein CkaCkLH20_02195 [Colletotrichum karsti]KAF9880241.1 hypothetical protein CkaCkLH20_02195 [Colletotrichum karsti]
MALRQQLTLSFVIDDTNDLHTHTVIFLHRFPESTTDEQLHEKVLCQKLTKNHKTLREQFPTIRWVFPFAKATARPWNNLTPEDRAAVGMTLGAMPYITQVILHEAKRARGLDRIILGGQGETAEAAHEAMSSFPECRTDNVDDVAVFVEKYFHPAWTELTQLKLAGFVGMHAQDGEMTRDVKNLGIVSKQADGKQKVNTNIVVNTPHRFIHGGYKLQTKTWDGKRIDDFAKFLDDIGVFRIPDEEKGSKETLTPKDREPVKKWDPRENLNDVQKHALEVEEQKKANNALREKILVRIEADKVERKLLQERQRQRRMFAQEAQENPRSQFTGSVNMLGGPVNRNESLSASGQLLDLPDTYQPYSDEESSDISMSDQEDGYDEPATSPESNDPTSDHEQEEEPSMSQREKARQGRKVDDGKHWSPRVHGEMTPGQMKALGLLDFEDSGEEQFLFDTSSN